MERKKVWAVYFSATDTTKKTVLTIADEAARLLGAEREDYDFTLPGMRENGFAAGKDDLVIFGTPVYAGRVPNVLLKYLATIQGNGALAVPVVLFGNRNFDDGLIELRDILENTGFHTPVFRRSTRNVPSFSSRHFFISFPASRFFLYLQQIFNALLGLFLLKKFF